MKKSGILFLIILFLCTGCGTVENAANSPAENLKSYVKEKSEKELYNIGIESESEVFVTKNCLYYESDDPEVECASLLIQCDYNGMQLNKYPLKEKRLKWVWENHVCYTQEIANKEKIFLAPIELVQGKESVQWSEAEPIAETKELIYDTFVWKNYVYYISDTLYRYDCKTGKTKMLGKKNEFFEGVFQKKEGTVYVQDEKIYLLSGPVNQSLYSVELTSGRVDLIGLGEEELDANELFYAKGNRIFVRTDAYDEKGKYLYYDKKEKKKLAVLREDVELKNFLKKNGLWKENMSSYLNNGFFYGNRLYLFMHLYWSETEQAEEGTEQGNEIAIEKTTQILVSCPWEDITNLKYEKEISSCLEKRQDYVQFCDEREDRTGEVSCWYYIRGGADFWTFCGGEILISYVKKREENHYAKEYGLIGYDLKTGEVREVPKEDVLYQIFLLI